MEGSSLQDIGDGGRATAKASDMQALHAMLHVERQSLSPPVFREEDFEGLQDSSRDFKIGTCRRAERQGQWQM